MRRVDLREPRRDGTNEGLHRQYVPEVLVFRTTAEVDRYAADRVAKQLRRKPDSVLTLPTGNTPKGMYSNLVDGGVDFSRATVFNLDEYWPIQPDNSNSYTAYMRTHLVDRTTIGIWHIPDGGASDPHAEAARYQALLDQQPVDLAVIGLGSGTTCHIGFNERGSSVSSKTRYAEMDEQTRRVNSELFDDPTQFPDGTITQGVADILSADQIVLIAKGPGKAWGINRILKGEISSDAPGSFLRLHPNVTIILDEEAAAYLT